MTLAQKVKTARLALGLSQRQLCGAYMTRNMLSLIENGSAQPSMETLRFLAGQLGKSVSYFLEDQAVISPNIQTMEQARTGLALGDLETLRQALDSFQEPDPVFWQERQLLEFLWHLLRAEQALQQEQLPYAVTLLQRGLELPGIYVTKALRQRASVLLTLAGGPGAPELEKDTLLALALEEPEPQRKAALLRLLGEPDNDLGRQLQARAWMDCGAFAQALALLEQCPASRQVLLARERCCKELGDYKTAYEISCQLRENL